MNTYIGIDLGTSAAKLLLCDGGGRILNSVTENYPLLTPRVGWTEQNPDDWLAAVESGVRRLLSGHSGKDVKGIGVGGQMHGLVALDGGGNVIRPCILWNDGRTEKQTKYLNETIGRKELSRMTANIAFAGFTAPKLLWLKENEPQNFARIRKIMLPKDYVVYKLTGKFSTDCSDASGTLLFDVEKRDWSGDMCRLTGIDEDFLPRAYESRQAVGNLLDGYCKLWDIGGAVVCAGAGDNAAAAVGTGVVGNGGCNISLGTSGTVFVSQSNFSVDEKNALHSFCHADGGYHLMGCILSAAACNSWWMKILSSEDFNAEQQGLERLLGKNDVYFLPYLSGERSPHNDVTARGAFLGLTHGADRQAMTLAVLEGVAFALNDCLAVARAGGLEIKKTMICGGGAKSALWRKIVANVCDITVETPAVEEGPAYGAAILSMVACGQFESVADACAKLVKVTGQISPDPEISSAYRDKYEHFKRFYPALKGLEY